MITLIFIDPNIPGKLTKWAMEESNESKIDINICICFYINVNISKMDSLTHLQPKIPTQYIQCIIVIICPLQINLMAGVCSWISGRNQFSIGLQFAPIHQRIKFSHVHRFP